MAGHLVPLFWCNNQLAHIDKQLNDLNFISVLLVFFLVLGQRLHFSIAKLLSHLEITEDLVSDYEKQQFFIIRDSFSACLQSIYFLKIHFKLSLI